MRNRLTSATLACALFFVMSLPADWASARQKALEVAVDDGAFKSSVQKLLDSSTPADIKEFVEANPDKKGQVSKVLVQFLEHETPVFRMAAVGWLNRVGDASVLPDMIKVLRTGDDMIRRMAAAFVGRHGGDEIRTLIEPLASDPDKGIRSAAVNVIMVSRQQDLAPLLGPLLIDDEEMVRQMAGRALTTLLELDKWLGKEPPAAGSGTGKTLDEAARQALNQECLKLGASVGAIGPAITAFFAAPDAMSAANIIAACGENMQLAGQVLAKILEDDRESVRMAALQGLERLGDTQAASAIVTVFLQESRQSVKIAAARALKRMVHFSSR